MDHKTRLIKLILILLQVFCYNYGIYAQEGHHHEQVNRRGSLSTTKTSNQLAVPAFTCPDEFGYYPHPSDCTQYYVCVFGGALIESCTGGLMYSHELQTCDWPRNVECNGIGNSTIAETKIKSISTANSKPEVVIQNYNKQRTEYNENNEPGGLDNEYYNNIREGRSYAGSIPNYKEELALEQQRGRSSNLNTALKRHRNSNQDQQQEHGYYEPEQETNLYSNHRYAENLTFINNQPIQQQKQTSNLNNIYNTQNIRPATTVSTPINNGNRFLIANNNGQQGQGQVQGQVQQNTRIKSTIQPVQADDYYIYEDEDTPSSGSSSGVNSYPDNDYYEQPPPESEILLPQKPIISTSTTSTTQRPVTRTRPPSTNPRGNNRLTLKPSSTLVKNLTPPRDIYLDLPSRPEPIYETPEPNTIATKCKKDLCQLPDCHCGGKDVPGGQNPTNLPQIVLLTFDDSVNDLNKDLYKDLFEKGRKNPNGCPISATFYVSHEWTDYGLVQNLAADGHELASHTVSHSFGEQFSYKKWSSEVNGQREILAAYGGIKLSEIRGMRAPFLAIGGNNMFKMLYDLNFTYDSSMPVYENRPPSWPYTLDYKLFHDCMIPPCPTKSFPGLWEVPMVMWQDLKGGRCSMGDACSNPPTAEGVYDMLAKNFERHYNTNRAPFGLFYHAAWFTQPHHKEGFESFLDTLTAMDDVWIVTNWQGIQYTRNQPLDKNSILQFEPFNCDNTKNRPKRCNNSKVCNLWHKSGVRYMRTCQPCPEQYPWTGNTGIITNNFI